MEKKKNRGNVAFIIGVVCFAIIVGSVALVLYSIFSQKETRTSVTREEGELGVLECKASSPMNAFFQADGETNPTQKVKVMMTDGKAGDMSYEYSATFASSEKAKGASAAMQANFNIDLGAEASKLSSTFNAIDDTVRINIYASAGKLNSANAKIFFLTTDEMLDFYSLSQSALERIFMSKGLSCSYSK